MKANYIFKPDMLIDDDAINYFYKLINATNFVTIKNMYEINDWKLLSKILYEENKEENKEENDRKKYIIGTIIAYNELYKNNAKIIEIEFNESLIDLKVLYEIKKTIRKNYAYNKLNYYIDIQNINEINFDKKLVDININDFVYNIIKSENKLNNSTFIFSHLNYIHFSDPFLESIKEDNEKILEYNRKKNIYV